jgi:hypothetical protein
MTVARCEAAVSSRLVFYRSWSPAYIVLANIPGFGAEPQVKYYAEGVLSGGIRHG